MQRIFTTKSNPETIALGSKLGELLCGGEFVALTGDLGGGKTQFTKGIAKGLGITETVISPTFTIERIYQSTINQQSPNLQLKNAGFVELHHFDLYRTHNDQEIKAEIKDLTTDDKNVVVVEWPENIEGILPSDYILVEFKYLGECERELKFISHGQISENLMEKL